MSEKASLWPYERITALLSVLTHETGGITVSRLSDITGSSAKQTCFDLYTLNRYGVELAPKDIVCRFMKYNVRYDEVEIMLLRELPSYFSSGCGAAFLTQMERSLFLGKGLDQLLLKSTPLSVTTDISQSVETIEKAIRDGQKISFRYRQHDRSNAMPVTISPHFMYYNVTDNLYYCISLENAPAGIFRLDHIRFGIKIEDTAAVPVDPDDPRLSKLPYIWGSAFSFEEEPVHAKIMVYPNTQNLLRKMKADTKHRKYGKWAEQDGTYTYEDDVIGISAFRAWLYSFGSSVKVLEPLSLAREVKRSSERRLRMYEEMENPGLS